jgi:adenylate cyclase
MANETDAHEQWRKILIEGHRPLRILHSLFRYLPGPPRCKGCLNPFGGIGGKLVRLTGSPRRERTRPSAPADVTNSRRAARR